jgi:hypothetical protein
LVRSDRRAERSKAITRWQYQLNGATGLTRITPETAAKRLEGTPSNPWFVVAIKEHQSDEASD